MLAKQIEAIWDMIIIDQNVLTLNLFTNFGVFYYFNMVKNCHFFSKQSGE